MIAEAFSGLFRGRREAKESAARLGGWARLVRLRGLRFVWIIEVPRRRP